MNYSALMDRAPGGFIPSKRCLPTTGGSIPKFITHAESICIHIYKKRFTFDTMPKMKQPDEEGTKLDTMSKAVRSDKEGDKLETISKMSPQTTHSDVFSLEEETKKIDNMTIFSVHKTPSQEINLKIKNSINI